MTFNECFNKYFVSEMSMFVITGRDPERTSLMMLKLYNGSYELTDDNLGALIMHVKLGNISGYSLPELLKKLNFGQEFENDIMNKLSRN